MFNHFIIFIFIQQKYTQKAYFWAVLCLNKFKNVFTPLLLGC